MNNLPWITKMDVVMTGVALVALALLGIAYAVTKLFNRK